MARGPTILTRFGAHVRGALRALAGLRALAALALLAVVGLRVLDPAALETARLNTFDAFQQINPRDPGESRVAIVDIDEASLAEFGQWPWSRDRMARLVAKLDAAEAAAIGFDIVFSEADRLSPDAFALETPGLPGMVRGVLAGLPNTDAAFAAAIAATPTVLGMSANTIPPDPDRPPLRAKSPLRAVGGDPRPHLFAFPSALRNIAPLEEAARAVGMFSLTPEPDGAVRRVPLAVRAGGRVHPSLSLETLRLAQGAEAGPARIEMRPGGHGVSRVTAGAASLATDANARVWVRYAPHDPGLYVSAADVLTGRMDPARVAGKLVLVGTSAVGLRDLRNTALGETVPGVEVHAQVIDTALSGDQLTRPVDAASLEHLLAAAIAGLLIWAAPRLSAARTLPIMAGALIAIWGGAYLAFAEGRVLIDPTYPSLAALASFAVLAFGGYARAERQRRQIRSAFGQYLSPDLVARLADDPDSLALGGESREMTFLFCDIAGFTSFVERADPQDLVRLLNEYLDGVCQIVMAHGGTIDKIVGDAVHAMFNAPMDDPDHAANAVRAAVEIEAFVVAFRAEKTAQGFDFGSTRIGVNTGPAVVGNFGGARRFDYTAHGDAINTAARLEGVNKHLGTAICVSGATKRLCPPELRMRPIGQLYLKGKDEPVEAFTPVRAAEDGRYAIGVYALAYERMAAEAPDAAAAFAKLADDFPEDPLVALHARRLAEGATGADIRMSEK